MEVVNELLTVVLICLFKRSRAIKDSYISVTTCFVSVIGFLHSIRNDECTMLCFDGRKLNVKIPYIYPDLYYNKMPYKFCKPTLVCGFSVLS